MALPVLTTLDDVNTWVNFLKTKINGTTVKEAEAIIGKQYIDGRKLAALQAWSITSRSGGRINLSPAGWDYARANADGRVSVLRDNLLAIAPYRAALEWAHFQRVDVLTTIDVGSRWIQFHKGEVETENETTLNYNAICFFHLAEGAGLGKLIVGRRGQPTRLELDRGAVASVFDRQSAPGASGFPQLTPSVVGNHHPEATVVSHAEALEDVPEPSIPTGELPKSEMVERIFIGHGKNPRILDQIKTILAYGKFEAVIAEEEETTAIPVPEKVMDAMHTSQAGIMNISADEQVTTEAGEEQYNINDNVLIEVGAAFVLYKKNVILLVDDRVKLPSNLQGLYICKYHGDSLDFDSAMKLQETLTKFRE